MGDERWRPLHVRGDPEAEDAYDALHEGVPDWLWPSLDEWRQSHCRSKDDALYVQRRLRLQISERYGHLLDSLEREIASDPTGRVLLAVVDALLARLSPGSPQQRDSVVYLGYLLLEAGSVWTVVRRPGTTSGYMLERRVDATVAAAVRAAMEHGRPGQHLREAWVAAYGRDHNASHAYREAVRAVESAAKTVVSPNNSAATLGTMIGDLRNKPEKWTVVLGAEGCDSVGTIRYMCELLWKSQLDRHGTDDETVPLNVSLPEAQAAVHVAATLVQLFSTESVRRSDD